MLSSIIGNGQLANIFNTDSLNNTLIFASGVSDSSCISELAFRREEELLKYTLTKNENKKFVYFSSTALSADNYELNDYYLHKKRMEKIVKQYSNNFFIFRIPQLFGELKKHKTLINHIYNSIKFNNQLTIFSSAERYVIEIKDAKLLVESYLAHSESNITVDLANPYRYKVIEIVVIFENLLNKKAIVNYVNKVDKYDLNLNNLTEFIEKYNINIHFSPSYLEDKLMKEI